MTNPAGADPTSYLLDGWDGVLFGAGSGGISGLQSLSQEAVMIAKQAAIEGNVVLQTILSLIFTGLRDGIPLALSIIEGLAVKLLGLIPGFTTVEEALDAIGQVPLVVDIVQALTGVANGTLTDIESWATALGIGLSDAAALVQAAIDAIANALGHPGTGHTPADLLVYVANIPGDAVSGVTRDWSTALAALQLPNPLALIQQIPQSIPAMVRGPDGGITAIGSGFTKDAEGAITFVSDGLTHLVKQGDGAILSLQQVAGQIVHATNVVAPTPGTGVADVMNAGQTAHTALTGAIEQVGVTVEGDIVAGANLLGGVVQTASVNAAGAVGQIVDATENAMGGAAAAATEFGQALGGALGGLLGLFPGGSPAPAATPAQIQNAALLVQTLLANHTADIANLQALLSGGSSGMNVLIPMSGVLPAGFTSMGPLAPAALSAFINSAVYTAATAPTNAQSVSAIWSANPPTGGYILILNANTAFTTYNYLKIYVTFSSGFYWVNFELGSVVAGVQATLDSQTLLLPSRPNPTSIPNNGFTFECDATGLNFDVLYNGASIFTFTDPGGHVVPGAGQRSFGWATSETSLPGAIVQWGASSPAATIGSGFMATRVATGAATTTAASPSSVTLGSGATFNLVLFSASCFDTTPFITSDITYNSPTNTATIGVAGWYKVDVSLDIVYSGTGSAGPALFHNGALFKLGPSMIGSSSDTFVLSRSFTVYCAAGDTLTPAALVNGAGFTGPYGDSGGVGTYWSVSLMNCGTLS